MAPNAVMTPDGKYGKDRANNMTTKPFLPEKSSTFIKTVLFSMSLSAVSRKK